MTFWLPSAFFVQQLPLGGVMDVDVTWLCVQLNRHRKMQNYYEISTNITCIKYGIWVEV